LPRGDAADSLDVVLASEWAHLWELNASVLPLAFGSAKGNIPEAGATLLLDYVTRQLLGLRATYADDALATLRIDDSVAIDRLDRGWPEVLEQLRHPGRAGLNQAYNALVGLLATETDVAFPAVRGNYTKRLGWLRERVILPSNLVPGLTVHQAKGREWGSVGVAFKDEFHAALLAGLSVTEARHRQIYVACTRAKDRTLAV
jgi:DNA helicase-2/ATP-dependent DNA helicase PcrA